MSRVVERLFLTVPRGCLQFVIVVFPDHTHLLFWKIAVTAGVISAAHSCKTLFGSSSGSAALSTFIFWSSLNTPSSPIDSSGMSFSTQADTSGRSWLLSLENPANCGLCSLRESGFLWFI